MPKTLRKVLEVYEPKSADEKKFKDKHVVAKHADANGNKDDVFKATNVKTVDRYKEAHGYNPGQDEKVYEEVESLDEITHEGAVRAASVWKGKGDMKRAGLYMKLAKALERNDKTTAAGIESQLAVIKKQASTMGEEMSTSQMKKREDIVKGMKKNLSGFKQRYGKEAKSVMYATATKRAMGEETVLEELDTTLLQLYINLDEDNQVSLLKMLDEGRKDELMQFAQTIMEQVDVDNN